MKNLDAIETQVAAQLNANTEHLTDVIVDVDCHSVDFRYSGKLWYAKLSKSNSKVLSNSVRMLSC